VNVGEEAGRRGGPFFSVILFSRSLGESGVPSLIPFARTQHSDLHHCNISHQSASALPYTGPRISCRQWGLVHDDIMVLALLGAGQEA